MDKILSYWEEREDAFPKAMRAREETGCCTSATLPYAGVVAGSDVDHALPA